MTSIAFVDLETDTKTGKILDAGAVMDNGSQFHQGNVRALLEFIAPSSFLCGHNIIRHDIPTLEKSAPGAITGRYKIIDTLYLSPLLFPSRPYHRLLKDDKLQADELNNPLNDAIKAQDLFYDEVNAFRQLDTQLADIFSGFCRDSPHLSTFSITWISSHKPEKLSSPH